MSALADLASKLFNPDTLSRTKILPTEKRIRGVLDGQYIFDTTAAKLVWEGYFPLYWIPRTDFSSKVKFEADKPVSGVDSSTSTLTVGGKSVPSLIVPESFESELKGYVKIEFKALEAWYEEQVQLTYHPKDPFHRVDVLPTGRHVKVTLNGVVLADTGSEGGVLGLWETNIPARWYLPRTSIKWEYLKPSETHTGCPYKGTASYYDAVIDGKVVKDVAWWYESPILECGSIIGMLCFYPDKVETLVDGKLIGKAINGK
jgi:uncharacterized protein (DUF427 family)